MGACSDSMKEKEREAEQIDVAQLMQGIRERVKTQLEEFDQHAPQPRRQPIAGQLTREEITPVIFSEELRYLNQHYHDWFSIAPITSARRYTGLFIIRAKNFIVDAVWHYMFQGYIEREREFHKNLVRFLNETAKYIDTHVNEKFLELVRKVDYETGRIHERIERSFDELAASIRSLERELNSLQLLDDKVERVKGELVELSGMLRGLERLLAKFGKRETPVAGAVDEQSDNVLPQLDSSELNYLLLENRYRGSEEEIAERLSDYLSFFDKIPPGKVLDIGCGRGEFLRLLQKKGLDALGVDLNKMMIAECSEKGLPVVQANALSYLADLADGSVAGIFAAQFAEHLERKDLELFLRLSAAKLKTGGRLVLETVNPTSLTALSSNFFRDPTHYWPLHPETLRFMLEMNGFRTEEIMFRSPFPAGVCLQKIAKANLLPLRWSETVQTLNDNLDRLNQILFGYQDFAVIGTKE